MLKFIFYVIRKFLINLMRNKVRYFHLFLLLIVNKFVVFVIIKNNHEESQKFEQFFKSQNSQQSISKDSYKKPEIKMSTAQSHSQTSSPSFPSIEQISGDIFFQVKKEILDRLDIILQKVNLEVIEYLKPETQRKEEKKTFHFIELSSFEQEIQNLFDYLDRLYESLNSSISFSSTEIRNTLNQTNKNKSLSVAKEYNSILVNEINEMKLKFSQLGEETIRLREENQHMKFLIKANLSGSVNLSMSVNQESKTSLRMNGRGEQKSKDSVRSLNSKDSECNRESRNENPQNEGISLQTVRKILRFYNHSIKQLSMEYKQTVKQIKRLLKQSKFQIIQNRVQCIAQLKKWTQKGSEAQSQQNDSSFVGQKSRSRMSPTFQAKNNSIQQVSVGEQYSVKQKEEECTQECMKKRYEEGEEKNGFEQCLLDKIQEILDVC